MMQPRPRHVLLTGAPGSGKTTVVVAVLRLLSESGRATFGFWTQEIREGGARKGFALKLVSGAREMLASVGWPGPPRVGKYGVKVEVMERLVVPEIERGLAAAKRKPGVVVVMDEIGKMELFSRAFQQVVVSAFDSAARVLATIVAGPHRFADSLKKRADVKLITLTRQNRESLAEEIAEFLRSA